MTLFRKGLIRWKSHAFWYGLALVIAYNYIRITMPPMIWIETFIVFMMRIKLGMDKYVHWTIYIIYKMFEKHPMDMDHVKASLQLYAPKIFETVYFGSEVGVGSWILLGLLFGFIGKKMSVNLISYLN